MITVLGSINMDLVVRTAALPRPGQTLLGSSFDTICGGKGGNQAIAAARAGGRVRMLGAVGDDAFGAELRAHLIRGGVDAEHLRTAAGSSGIAAITVDDAAENVIVVVPGANGTVSHLTADEEESIADADMVVCQLEIPLPTVTHAAQVAASAETIFLLNPSPIQPLPNELLGAVTLLVLNEGEAAEIDDDNLADIPHVVTTLGARGATYRGPEGVSFTVGAPAVHAVDTTGAGDAFTGALAVAWTEGLAPLEAVRRACAAGALATTVAGADSAPARAAIERLVAETYAGT